MKIQTQEAFLPFMKVAMNEDKLIDSRIADYVGSLAPYGIGNALVGAVRAEDEDETGKGAVRGGLGGLGGGIAGGLVGIPTGALAGALLGSLGGGVVSMVSGAGPVGAAPGIAMGAPIGAGVGGILGTLIGGAEGGRYFTKKYLGDKTEEDHKVQPKLTA